MYTNAYRLSDVGNFIKKARKKCGLDQVTFAEELNISHATLSALETGKNVSSQTMISALQYLGFRLCIVRKDASVKVQEANYE